MSTFRTLLLILGIVALGYGVGRVWKLKPETAAHHIVHSGEEAVLAGGTWIAIHEADAQELQNRMTAKDDLWLSAEGTKGSAFFVAAGTRVKVRSESSSSREIEVLEGPLAGRKGWVKFEYLRLPLRGER